MQGMSSLESRIDSLYRGSADEFTAARNALAKTLAGDDARRVKQLVKPTSVAWAVNQLYWQRRPSYDRLIKTGKHLRTVQIGALNGRSVDVRSAVEEHREGVAQAVADAVQLASETGINLNADELSRTLESLSLGSTNADPPGRLTKALQPAGFEALAGVVVKAPARAQAPAAVAPKETRKSSDEASERKALAQQARDRKAAADAERRKAAAIKQANEVVARARIAEERARSEWERRKRDRDEAEEALARLQRE